MQLLSAKEELVYEGQELTYGQFLRSLGLLQLTALPVLDASERNPLVT